MNSSSDVGIEGDFGALAGAIGVHIGQLIWLLGAGASAISEILTAGQLTLRFKRELYCAANGLDIQCVDPADPRTRRLIADHFGRTQTLPGPGDNDEYAVSFEQAFPSADARADLIAGFVEA